MSGLKDYQRGEQAGYSGFSKGPARNNLERMGRAAGEAQRDRERQIGSEDGRTASGISFKFFLLIVAALIVIGFTLSTGRSVSTAMVLVAILVGLMLTRVVRRVLRFTTPVYVGAMLGLFFGCFRLFMTNAPLVIENLIVYPLLGAVLGLLFVIVRRVGK